MKTLDEKITRMEERLKQLKHRQVRIEARRRTLSSRRSRRDDTRRKILVGAVVLTKVDQGVLPNTTLQEWLDDILTRVDDRILFSLPALTATHATAGHPTVATRDRHDPDTRRQGSSMRELAGEVDTHGLG
jgi:hypothetical protein